VHGRVSTLINFLMFALGFALQWGIGLVVNRYPAGMPGRYEAAGYEHAFMWLWGLQALCVAWTLIRLRSAAVRNEGLAQS